MLQFRKNKMLMKNNKSAASLFLLFSEYLKNFQAIYKQKIGPFPASFPFNAVNSKWNCRCLEWNSGFLVSKAIALPTSPQPLPKLSCFLSRNISIIFGSFRQQFKHLTHLKYVVTSVTRWQVNFSIIVHLKQLKYIQ